MHGGLARWLRAAGYDAAWQYGIEDPVLLRRAAAERRTILTSDGPLMQRRSIRRGELKALFVPRGLSATDALRFVLGALGLSVKGPHCMACGGSLARVPKESVIHEAPPKTYAWLERFFRCTGCGKLYWEGTHWKAIGERLANL
jgi:uncharacterized protein with PIN domain